MWLYLKDALDIKNSHEKFTNLAHQSSTSHEQSTDLVVSFVQVVHS